MAISAFQPHFYFVHIQTIAFAQFNTAKTNHLFNLMNDFFASAQLHLQLVALRIFRRPGDDLFDFIFYAKLLRTRRYFCEELAHFFSFFTVNCTNLRNNIIDGVGVV